ncbi:hypothetical protein [Moraxella sp. ZY210820]|uniref:hypothetical protein n=1 Tax=unclassified Moraxella TaxID=2685852 RepID=UPI002731E6CE|nr:hypothetical protein [Moraxella sp. ZY210820]WLF83924.1 hypothetical protein LU301_11960 [Moraxella sp. ZY210820]
MNDKQNLDLKKSYKHLSSMPMYLLYFVLHLFGILSRMGFIKIEIKNNIDDYLFFTIFFSTVIIGLIFMICSEKWIRTYFIKQQFSPEKLNKYEKISNYFHKITSVIVLTYWALHFYQFFNP